MNYQNLLTVSGRQSVVALAAILGVFFSQPGFSAAEAVPGLGQQKSVVGRAPLISGGLLHREGENKSWRLIAPSADIYADDLIVAVPAGAILPKSGHVRLTLLSDLARISPYPVFESAVILHDTDLDLDFTLDRGRVDITNLRKDKGEAKVRVRFQKQVWDLTLGDKAKIALELYGRWPAGMHFSKTPKPGESPTIDVVLLVKEGELNLKVDGNEFAMHAPKGVAYFHWDSVPPFDDKPKYLDALPAWAKPIGQIPQNVGDIANLIKAIGTRAREKPGSIEEVLATILTEDSPSARRMAVYGLGAIDDLPQLIDALSSSKFPDVRDVTVIALRHWIGRGEGQDMKLYDALVKKGYSENHAARVMQLLHSFGEKAKASPATYETLIDLLNHENPAVRQLANWHLTRLVPTATITYDPLGTPEERQAAVAKWKELIPAGKLPPKP